MPRRATRSANCHREVADNSVALPKDRMPCAYSERASSRRSRSSTSPSGKRRLRATESETVSVMLIVLLKVYTVGGQKNGGRSEESVRRSGQRKSKSLQRTKSQELLTLSVTLGGPERLQSDNGAEAALFPAV